jgi:hypothetical protein
MAVLETETARGVAIGAKAAAEVAKRAPRAMENFMVSSDQKVDLGWWREVEGGEGRARRGLRGAPHITSFPAKWSSLSLHVLS